MKNKHPEIVVTYLRAQSGESTSTSGGSGITTASAVLRKRGPIGNLVNLCAKKRRPELFQQTIPNWVDTRTKLKFTSDRAQRLTKYLFEWMVLDLAPFNAVAKPGT